MKRLLSVIPLALFLLILGGCEKDPPITSSESVIDTGGIIIDTTDQSQVIYVVNEGNFQNGNASITYYSRHSGRVEHEVFQQVNGYLLGDVAQSMTIQQQTGYIVVNNSQKIEVVDLKDFSVQTTISSLTSPRYMEIVNDQKAYVTDMYADKVSIIDLENYSVSGQIPISGWTEQLLQVGDEVWITNADSAAVYMVGVEDDRVSDSVPVAKQPLSMVKDKNGDVWVLCSGGLGKAIPALYRFDTSTHQVEQQFTFSSKSMFPEELVISPGRDTLYYLNDGVYRMPITAVGLPAQPVIASEGRNFYGLGIDPKTHHIFVSDAGDYTQDGGVYRYTPRKTLVDSFTAGRIPGDFAFPE